jgi:hypothetical protein
MGRTSEVTKEKRIVDLHHNQNFEDHEDDGSGVSIIHPQQ